MLAIIFLLSQQRESVVATLEGHNGNVTCAEFCPHYRSTLVSISEDRTYKVSKFSFNPKSATYNLQQTTISNFAAFSKITNKA